MPPTDANDPLRTTDRDPSAAPPAADATTDDSRSSSVVDRGTVAYVPGPKTERRGSASEHGIASISVPGYEILDVLGRGGMGVVYKARHLALKRVVALKTVLAGGHAGPRELARFRVEAEAVARLSHPNIVQIHEVGEAGGHPYCALEFVTGGNLAGRIGGKPMPGAEAARLVEALARAMQLAHSRNVVHRDLKPANILLAADGTPKITDFGLARQLDSDSGATQDGAVMGTPSYMALVRGQVRDLEPLRGMPLTTLLLTCAQVRDLEPLKGMPLTTLKLNNCVELSDLEPLRGMPLTSLYIGGIHGGTQVRDLSPLENMKLKFLNCADAPVSDLTPLKEVPLQDIRLTPRNITKGLDTLRDMKSLRIIGIDYVRAWPAAEFWARHGKGEFNK